jgi:pimeloyl-ACP methyl ester carboxylesterase
MTTTAKAVSSDGTQIAYDRRGSGPPLVLVDGAFCRRGFGPMPKIAPLLATSFTVLNYDRRGRGDSGDAAPYALARELDDLDAVIAAAGDGPAHVFGISSGAMLALRAAARGARIARLVVYEPPLVLAGSDGKLPPDRRAEIIRLALAGDRAAATETFMRMVGVPGFAFPLMKLFGVWSKLTASAHTLPYDLALLGDTGAGRALPDDLATLFGSIQVPTTVGIGGKSPPYLHQAARTVQQLVPGASLRELPGQTHNVGARPMAAAIAAALR